MKKFLYITNIPTPYRTYRFNELAKSLLQKGIELEVIFMNKSEPDRDWILDTSAMKFNYKIFSERKVKKIFGMWLHFPIALFKYLMKQEYDILVLGGLASPAHFLAAFLLDNSKINILSVESNLESIQIKNKPIKLIKSYLMDKFNIFQVTGGKSREFIEYYTSSKSNRFVTLPNVIDQDVFSITNRLDQNVKDLISKERTSGRQIWFLPARLIEKKGIIPFLKQLKPSDNVSIFIAGSGPLRQEIDEYAKEYNLTVYLLGNLSSSKIPSIMKVSDFLVLPSKSDPYPLSPIEACYIGLPLIVSKNIGNYQDVVKGNGWGFEFGDEENLRSIIEKALSCSKKQRVALSEAGTDIFNDSFDGINVINKYVSNIMAISDERNI
jgi:glycosyltransferase involved in cell wall biosynthesis